MRQNDSQNILLIFPHFLNHGGAATATIELYKIFKNNGHKVSLICAKKRTSFNSEYPDIECIELNIPVSSSIFYWALLPIWQYKINKTISAHRDYILMPHVIPSNWWTWIYKLNHVKATIIWYCHEPSAFIHYNNWIKTIPSTFMRLGAKALQPLTRMFDLMLEKQNNFVICNSQYTYNEYIKIYKRTPTAVIYPPFKIPQINNTKTTQNYFFTISRLNKFKNVDKIIRAFNKFYQSYPEFRLIVAGTGECENELKLLASLSKSKHNIIFKGNIDENTKIQLYLNAKCTIIASENEAFGLVPLESLCLGTPVIAHNSGGPRETIHPGQTGFLFNSEKELLQQMKLIANLDPNEFKAITERCFNSSQAFTAKTTYTQLNNILNSSGS